MINCGNIPGGKLRKNLTASLVLLLLFSAPVFAGNWWENIKIKGDLRYRHEMIDNEDSDARHRHRVRVRLAIYGSANDYWFC